MSDDRYNLDDILKEIDTRRSDEEKGAAYNGSITEIIDGNEVERVLKAGVQKKKEPPRAAKQKKSANLSVTQVINDVEKNKAARQFTEDETEQRRSSDIERAMQNRKKPDGSRHGMSARQLTEEESDVRIARDIRRAIDERASDNRARTDFGDFEEKIEDFSKEYDEDFGELDDSDDVITPESEYVRPYIKPAVSGEDEDIIFHTSGDLVTTDTMQMRKQKKIDDINQALLKIDSEADSPDDILDSLNPMESREKAAEIIKSESGDEITDTLAVAGNDLKQIGKGEERIKEYHPSSTRKRPQHDVQDKAAVQKPVFPAEIHVGETIVEALNKKIQEQESEEKKSKDEAQFDDIQVDVGEENEPVNENIEKIKQANELAQKKKRRIANFILDHPDTEEIETAEDDEDEEYSENYSYDDDDEAIDLDDEIVIRDRLARASKGLISRLIILAVLFGATLFIAISNTFNLNPVGINKFINIIIATDNYIYTHLTIGILSFAACSSVVSNGFSRLFKLRPDADTLCAFAHVSAIAAMVPYLFNNEYVQRGRSHIYLLVSLGALIGNTISKLCTVRTAQKNYAFVFGENTKYFIERCGSADAERLAKGTVTGIPAVGSMRKTEMLCDFIVSTYCEDASDRLCRRIVPAAAAAAVVGAVCAFFTCADDTNFIANRINWAITVLTAIFSLGAAYCSSMTVTLPLLAASRSNDKRGSAILGYAAVAEISEINAALIEAKTLFPADSVKITNICGYDKPKSRGEGKINIDEAIILAASLAVASDSVLADAFFGMLNNKRELLKEVSGCVYENNLGVMGWIDRRRVLLGNRRHMKSHEITVPNMKKEAAANVNNDEVIYLAVGGEVCLLFFVHLEANAEIRKSVQSLVDSGVSMVIKTVDGMITDTEITDLFDIEKSKVKILPFEAHEAFTENTKFVSSGSAAVCCTGTFSSFAGAVRTAQILRKKTTIGSLVQLAVTALGFLLAIIFALFSNFGMFNMLIILLYNVVASAAVIGSTMLTHK